MTIFNEIHERLSAVAIKGCYTARLMELLKTARMDGSYLKLIRNIKRSGLLILDDMAATILEPQLAIS